MNDNFKIKAIVCEDTFKKLNSEQKELYYKLLKTMSDEADKVIKKEEIESDN